jgi:hypothetical protein
VGFCYDYRFPALSIEAIAQFKNMATESKKSESKKSESSSAHEATRVLLALWDLGGLKEKVKKGELTKRIVRTGQKSANYQPILTDLADKKAITSDNKTISLSDEGFKLLSAGLADPTFEFDTQIGAKTANALLRWMRESNGVKPAVETNGKHDVTSIASYEEFKPIALEVYNSLNRDYNLNHLVPIYLIRREIGDKVPRSQFNEWFLEMQSDDIIQLIGGEMPELTPDKSEDSIMTELGSMRYYIKCL